MLILISLEVHILITQTFKDNYIRKKKLILKINKVQQLYHKVSFLILKL